MATLSELERAYFARKTGLTQQTPLNQLKRVYWSTQIAGTTPQTPMRQLETNWLVSVIGAAGITPSKWIGDQWSQMVTAISQVAVKQITQNKRLFYTFAP